MKSILYSCIIFVFSSLSMMCRSGTDQTLTIPASRGKFLLTVNGEGELDAKVSQAVVAPQIRSRPTISWIALEGTHVRKGDLVVQLEAADLERDYRTALDQVEIARADAERNEADLTLQRVLLESQLKSMEASAAASKLQLSKLEFEPPRTQEIKRLEIQNDELEAEKYRRKLKSLEKIQKEDRAQYLLKIKQEENKVKLIESFLSQLNLKAPVGGIIVYEENWITDEKMKEGDPVNPRMPIVKIPDLSIMLARLQIGETEAQRIKAGQETIVRVPTMGEVEFRGKVTSVGRVARRIRRGSKVKKVEVVVELDSTDIPLAPGISATAQIEIGEVEDAVWVPRECIFERDSAKIIYVIENKRIMARPIEINTTTDDYAIVKNGLSGDEICLLTEPSESQVRWPDSLRTNRGTAVKTDAPAETDSANTLSNIQPEKNRTRDDRRL